MTAMGVSEDLYLRCCLRARHLWQLPGGVEVTGSCRSAYRYAIATQPNPKHTDGFIKGIDFANSIAAAADIRSIDKFLDRVGALCCGVWGSCLLDTKPVMTIICGERRWRRSRGIVKVLDRVSDLVPFIC